MNIILSEVKTWEIPEVVVIVFLVVFLILLVWVLFSKMIKTLYYGIIAKSIFSSHKKTILKKKAEKEFIDEYKEELKESNLADSQIKTKAAKAVKKSKKSKAKK